jgi:hypothetical protein
MSRKSLDRVLKLFLAIYILSALFSYAANSAKFTCYAEPSVRSASQIIEIVAKVVIDLLNRESEDETDASSKTKEDA